MKSILAPLAAVGVAVVLTASAASASVTLFSDNFNRATSDDVGNGWSELERRSNDVQVWNQTLILSNELSGTPDAAAASLVIDASGFKDIVVSFDWRAFVSNESTDKLVLSWAEDPAPRMTREGDWTEVTRVGNNGGTWSNVTRALGAAADNARFNLMFWTNVTQNTEGFYVDNVKVTGTAVPSVSAVPLPAALPLMLTAVAGAGVAYRRRRGTRA